MTNEEIEIGKFYTHGDDSTYKVVDKGEDWILTLCYSCNHRVANPWIFSLNDDIIEGWYEDEDDCEYIFDNLKFHDFSMLKEE